MGFIGTQLHSICIQMAGPVLQASASRGDKFTL